MSIEKRRGRKNYWNVIKSNLDKIEKLSANGATEKQIATEFLKISYSTFNKYKADKKELQDALKRGKKLIVPELRGAMIKRGLGFKYEEKKHYIKEEDGKKVTYTEITEKYALPDVAAMNLALKNYDEDWYNDKKAYDLKKQENELRKKMLESKEDW